MCVMRLYGKDYVIFTIACGGLSYKVSLNIFVYMVLDGDTKTLKFDHEVANYSRSGWQGMEVTQIIAFLKRLNY